MRLVGGFGSISKWWVSVVVAIYEAFQGYLRYLLMLLGLVFVASF